MFLLFGSVELGQGNKVKPYFYIIPLVAFFTAVFGSLLTSSGMDWYKTINLPSFTPPGVVIGIVWTIIFTLTAISAILVFNAVAKKKSLVKKLPLITKVFLLNAVLNIFWSFLFFNQHQILLAGFEAAILGLSVVALIILILPISKNAAYFLVPYAAWVIFATYLTFTVWSLNTGGR